MTRIEFTMQSESYPTCTVVLEGDTITITRMSRDKKKQIKYLLPTKDLQSIVASKRSRPHSPFGVYHSDTSVLYQPLPNTLTVTTKGNQFPFEFGYCHLSKIIPLI